ncbi:MAG TPA: ribosome maturation factor RimP [Rhizomicrobium sp.]|nr:ribosome maturation factor RimP [Rhizomicrobium sp.]
MWRFERAAARETLFVQELPILTSLSHLEPIIEPMVEAAGFKLVRLRVLAGKSKTLQIMAERPDGSMNVDDCAALSRALSEYLEAEDPIEGEYHLEISSPGIDRPLTRLTDFARWAGHEAKLELHAADESGRRKFRGRLLGVDGQDVIVEIEGERKSFAFRSISDAKLVLTDELIREDLKGKKQ